MLTRRNVTPAESEIKPATLDAPATAVGALGETRDKSVNVTGAVTFVTVSASGALSAVASGAIWVSPPLAQPVHVNPPYTPTPPTIASVSLYVPSQM